MKKIAIVYYSLTGNTDYVARKINDKIESDLIRLVPKKDYPNSGFKKYFWGGKSAVMGDTPELEKYNFNFKKYDHIIFGTPVWASSFTPPIRTFIMENMENLKDKQISVFISFSGGGADKTIDKLKKYLDIEEFDNELILIDPKDKQNNDNDKKINEFCKNIVKN